MYFRHSKTLTAANHIRQSQNQVHAKLQALPKIENLRLSDQSDGTAADRFGWSQWLWKINIVRLASFQRNS
jgi:hypothetical protein